MASRTAAFVPANLMNRVGCSAQDRLVDLTMLIVRIWLSSNSSIAATSTPALTVAATVLAASYMSVLMDRGGGRGGRDPDCWEGDYGDGSFCWDDG